MGLRNYIFNRKGQILIESVFLLVMIVTILMVFQKLIEFQKNNNIYRFSKNNERYTSVRKITTQDAK